MQSTDGGLEQANQASARCVVRLNPKQWVQNLRFLGKSVYSSWQLRVLKPQRNSRRWITAVFVAFAEKGLLQRKAISRAQAAGSPAGRPSLLDSDIATGPRAFPKARPSLLAAATARRRLGGPHFVLATRTLMTPHCSQTKADAKGKRRRGETKTWHAQRWAPPPRRRRRQGHQRERLDLGGLGRKESASGGSIHESASSSACKASKAATARRVLVAQAYRYIQRRQFFSERQESNQD